MALQLCLSLNCFDISFYIPSDDERKCKRQIWRHIARGIPEYCALGCLRFIHLNGEMNCMISLCVHVHFFEILNCTFAKAATIRYYQPIRNNTAPERN